MVTDHLSISSFYDVSFPGKVVECRPGSLQKRRLNRFTRRLGLLPQQPPPQGHGEGDRRPPFGLFRRDKTPLQKLRVSPFSRVPPERRNFRLQNEASPVGRGQQERPQQRHLDGDGIHVAQAKQPDAPVKRRRWWWRRRRRWNGRVRQSQRRGRRTREDLKRPRHHRHHDQNHQGPLQRKHRDRQGRHAIHGQDRAAHFLPNYQRRQESHFGCR
jgi:hypothetical protein